MPTSLRPSLARLGGYQPETSILSTALRALAQRLDEAGSGFSSNVETNVTLTGESAQDLFASVEAGNRAICYLASGYLSARVPELSVLDLPFSVTDRAAALNALDGKAGALLTSAVERRTDYKVLGYWDNGFRHVSNHIRPIQCAQDCMGLSIRTLDSANYRQTLASLGFQPITTDAKELVHVVRDRHVDAQENPLTNFMHFALWKYHPHLSMTGHFFGVLLLVCGKHWYDALPRVRRDNLYEAAQAVTALQRQTAAAEDETLIRTLAAHGTRIVLPEDLHQTSMRAATASLAKELRQEIPGELLGAYFQHG